MIRPHPEPWLVRHVEWLSWPIAAAVIGGLLWIMEHAV